MIIIWCSVRNWSWVLSAPSYPPVSLTCLLILDPLLALLSNPESAAAPPSPEVARCSVLPTGRLGPERGSRPHMPAAGAKPTTTGKGCGHRAVATRHTSHGETLMRRQDKRRSPARLGPERCSRPHMPAAGPKATTTGKGCGHRAVATRRTSHGLCSSPGGRSPPRRRSRRRRRRWRGRPA